MQFKYKLHKVRKQWVVISSVMIGLGIGGYVHVNHLTPVITANAAVNVATANPPKVFTKLSQYYDKVDNQNHLNRKTIMLTQKVSNQSAYQVINAKSIQNKGQQVMIKTKTKTMHVPMSTVVPAYYTHKEINALANGKMKNLLLVPKKQLSVYKQLSFNGGKTKIMRQNGFQIKGLRYYHKIPRFELVGGGYLPANRTLVKVFNLKNLQQPTSKKTVIKNQTKPNSHADANPVSSASTNLVSSVSSAIPSSANTSVSHIKDESASVKSVDNHGLLNALVGTTQNWWPGLTNGVNTNSGNTGLSLPPITSNNSMTTSPSNGNTNNSNASTTNTSNASTTNPIDAQIASANAMTSQPANQTVTETKVDVPSATVDKARYNPKDTVNLTYTVKNTTNDKQHSQSQVNIYRQNQLIHSDSQSMTMDSGQSEDLHATWTTPDVDYTGYRAEIVVNGVVKNVVAIDVSSDVNKFPRYGAVTQFTPGTDNSKVLNEMKDLNINNLEYYDAYQNPQNPMNTDDLLGNYTQDWAPWLSDDDKTKSGQVIKNTIDTGHQLNMDSMLYNMIYAITGNANDPDYLKSIGVKPEWLLYHGEGNDKDKLFQFHMAGYLPSTDPNYAKATQTYLDIKNPEVVDWIVNRMRPILEKMDFDGWHGDTIGENSLMYSKNADGSIKNEYHVDDELGNFANMVKQRLNNKKFVVNTVSGGGEDNVASSKTDFDYSETWTGTYLDIVNEIKRVSAESNKSLVIPAYLQASFAKNNPGSEFNENAVLLLDAMVNSAGGSRMEIVDGNHLLVGEFFPNKDLKVSDSLLAQLHNYQTFMTAYENLLRDGQKDNGNEVDVYNNDNQNVASTDANPNSVFAYSRSSDSSQTIQLINMLGVTSNRWQDDNGSREQPATLNNFHVKYRPSGDYQMGGKKQVQSVYLASPDGDNANQTTLVPFKWAHDDKGYYLDITVPQLQRWDMLYLK